MLKEGNLKWHGTLESLKKEFDTFAIKLRTEEPIKDFLEPFDFLEQVEYIDLRTAKITMRDIAKTNELLQELIRQNRTLVHYETMQDSLEDAYIKVIGR